MSSLNMIDTSFMFTATVLVFLMPPALALFYSGMVGYKNVVSTTMYVFTAMVIVSIQWVLFGYSLAFGNDIVGIIGNLDFIGFKNVEFSPNIQYASNIPHILFASFQLKFAIIAAALVCGAFIGRMRFPAYILFLFLWATFIYAPLAHWVWGVGGWLKAFGALDFAGGNVVHISSGVSGLVAALVLGKRREKHLDRPHNILLVALGAGVLWAGWFGFNAGSALGLNDVALKAFVCTNTAAATGAVAWMSLEYMQHKKITLIGTASGSIVGLVAITPAAGYVTILNALLIGFVGGVICYFAVTIFKKKFGYDDALDVFGCHGIGGIWGGIATGLFASKAVNASGANGLFYGNPKLLGIQLVSIGVTVIFVAFGTYVILKSIGLMTRLRATDVEERLGLDVSQHGERACMEST